ncbi:nuclear transport factor 2-like protein [Aquirufa lenticrescens]|uniref:hypothetical protein n=1 Tax=Aquirufa lenticrescens TaxID=2696560 RepID=UPI001CAA5F06|nr:hypothetical protein [Aquirufa lenticrescens]UAJ13988.1 hypothetical protein G9X62_05225 [Aquirufa lenticrescens]
MKKLIMIMAVATALFSCGQKQDVAATSTEASADSLGGTFTSTDEKSQIIQNQIKAAFANDTTYKWDEIADNIAVYYPGDTIPDIKGKKAYVADFTTNGQLWDNPRFSFLRVVTLKMNNGETWTNLWGTWHVKGKFTGKELVMNVHQALKWENDKVAQEIHFYDTKFIVDEFMAMEAAKKK